ncbi:uncharacterized protein NMK_2804 [Novimethylophilus kurashikiensis]|uniref:Uncharacterized protein n=1 Tax=Novimethylophilus kurashikiensis TaxID=1825523 RepID=A0A2R5FFU2_9PROT|nr:DUF5455 family protein [Novimethylophilus kurashikiensis]GBG15201.1 uncharacterized protein NMK_2804 [Novimethylophilus kurashikiensis]
MQLIFVLLGNLFGAFIELVGRKGLISGATIVAFLAVTAAFIVCMKQFIAIIAATILMPAWLSAFLGMFVPSNAVGCVSAILSAKTCKAAYRFAMRKINALNTAA